SFRVGRPGETWYDVSKGYAQSGWAEEMIGMGAMAAKQWCHLAATYGNQKLQAFVNGKLVGTKNWKHGISTQAAGELGTYHGGTVSHKGLIDDLRLYKRALTAEEIAQLADRKGRESVEYAVNPANDSGKKLHSLETRWATMTITDNGYVSSIRLKADGKELLVMPTPIAIAMLKNDDTEHIPLEASLEADGVVSFKFPNMSQAKLRIRFEANDDYFKIVPVQYDVPEMYRMFFFRMAPKTQKYLGIMSGIYSDDEAGLCLRSLGLKVDVGRYMRDGAVVAYAAADSYCGMDGLAAAVAAAPAAELAGILQRMAVAEGMPYSENGGPFSASSENTRGSYLFADITHSDTDAWIEFAKRGGFEFVHIHGWWDTLGHYGVNKTLYPNGLEDMKDTVDRIHAAGLKASFHTLTACIQPSDTWVSPVPSDDLISEVTYTLARPMDEKDDVIYVNEMPIRGHELVFTYSCNGNVIKIGKELIQYSEISREKPYAFMKCTRGAFKTNASAHAAGDKADYLHQRYIAFYPNPDSKLADELADCIANTYNYLGLDGMYFDGSEGMGTRYAVDAMRWKIFKKLKGAPVIEASQWGHNNWWFHTRLGAWDHPLWSMKHNHDAHSVYRNFRKSELLQSQLGWWAPRGPSEQARGQFMDELEYFAAKNLAIDSPMSIQGVNVSKNPWNGRIDEMMTILGWHERFRLARYFTEADLERVGAMKSDFILRMDDAGKWRLRPMAVSKRRLTTLNKAPESWSFNNQYAEQNASLRIEALYSLINDSDKSLKFIDFGKQEVKPEIAAAQNVTQKVDFLPPGDGITSNRMAVTATNNGTKANGAWTKCMFIYPHPYKSLGGCRGFGLWVKGDASGAVLCVQFASPYMYAGAVSDHYIDIDFKGWKYFSLLFRERDTERMPDFLWPYSTAQNTNGNTRSELDFAHISTASVFLNMIPANGTTSIEISDIVACPNTRVTLNDISLSMNGRGLSIPVSMTSGDYIEIDPSGIGSLFGENGSLKQRFVAAKDGMATAANGGNAFTMSAKTTGGFDARAEVTMFTLGEPFGTRRAGVNWKRLEYEYEMPRFITRQDGIDNVWSIMRRDEGGASPNDNPRLEFTLDVCDAGHAKSHSGVEVSVIDDCADVANYLESKRNDYAKFVYDGTSQGTAKPGVTFKAVNAAGMPKHDDMPATRNSISFTATNNGDGNSGWAAIGRRFDKPLDLSKANTLGVWVKGVIGGAVLKMQLRDVNGAWHNMTVTSDRDEWHYTEFDVSNMALDASKVEYILYIYNGLSRGVPTHLDIGGVVVHKSLSRMKDPVLTINDAKVKFPCSLSGGETLRCRDGRTFDVLSANGIVLSSGDIVGAFPTLHAGRNNVKLEFGAIGGPDFKVEAKITKVY
ncbi:MAG: hypothetical protein J5833_07155, partial [Victivallales bacterium]|nr:hypothetical protein [Victivallales bacterium]